MAKHRLCRHCLPTSPHHPDFLPHQMPLPPRQRHKHRAEPLLSASFPTQPPLAELQPWQDYAYPQRPDSHCAQDARWWPGLCPYWFLLQPHFSFDPFLFKADLFKAVAILAQPSHFEQSYMAPADSGTFCRESCHGVLICPTSALPKTTPQPLCDSGPGVS